MSPQTGRHSFLVVANRLPCRRAADAWRASPGGLVATLAPVATRHSAGWIGWSGIADDDTDPGEHAGMTLIPVRLSAAEVTAHYEGFANSTIWPLYHDNVIAPRFSRSWWESHQQVNRRFAEAVAASAAPGARVWVHDYQLQLVPQMVRRLRPDVRIGFFCHIPFPPVGLFAQLPWRAEVLSGLLGADVIGFQRRADVENFTAACIRLLGIDPRAEGRIVEAYPVSVDSAHITALARDAERQDEPERIRADLGDPQTVLLGIDRLDHTKGILERLLAVEELFDTGALDPVTTRLVQIAVPSREAIPAYRDLRAEVERTVGRINGKFAGLGGASIHYLHRDYPFESVVAWYLAADVLLATSLRDGMNLVAKEYVAARRGRGGVLVLSEFAGAADELTEALIVNPHDRDALGAAITRAVRMESGGAHTRIEAMAATVADRSLCAWATRFLDDLESVSPAALTVPPEAEAGAPATPEAEVSGAVPSMSAQR
ncbi:MULTISPECIES: alpha,alpha-trehalose-phosphate synthase (UDP-forming) [Brevibacterium]|uniref:Trehalose-6-phosphate synthase n=1 Tax=Brevibacterium ammoniilyticum TaxID=1046555 RepID=A0ABP9U3C5_9MICO